MTNPDHWDIEKSTDGGVTWAYYDVAADTDRSYNIGASGEDWRIYGADASDVQITGYSNVVTAIP
jgi:hypothetical protein